MELTFCFLLRQVGHACNFLINAAFSRCSLVFGPRGATSVISRPSLVMIESPGRRGPEDTVFAVVFLTTLVALFRLAGVEVLGLSPVEVSLERVGANRSSKDDSVVEKLENSRAGEAS